MASVLYGIDIDPRLLDRAALGPLHLAVLDRDTEAAAIRLFHGDDVNEISEDEDLDMTPLYIACRNDDRKMAQLLLDHGANPNKLAPVYCAVPLVLQLASTLGHHQFTRLLLQRGANVHAVDENGSTALHVACQKGHMLVVRLLLKYKAEIDAYDFDDTTPLTRACEAGNNQIALFLVAQGADVNFQRPDGRTPLFLCKCPRLAKSLLNEGARVNARDTERLTPLHEASHRGDLKKMQVLIDYKANVNAKNNVGRSPLHCAAFSNRAEAAKLLIANKAYINSRDRDKYTPLHECCRNNGAPQVARILLQNRAIVNVRDSGGCTPLYQACGHSRNPDVVNILIDHGANLHTQDADGDCPLTVAWDAFEVSSILVKRDPTCRLILEFDGNLPFHECASAEIARLLLESHTYDNNDKKGPEPACCWMAYEQFFARNNDGQTGLDTARDEDKQKHLVEYLASFKEESLAVPSSDSTTRKRKRDEGCLAVKLNPKLNEYQEHLATQTLKLVLKTPAHPVAYCVLGFLSAADVMKRERPLP